MNIDTQALIEEMAALIAKIKNGSATQGELEAFVAAASQVHERAVVLRYKSYEAKVFGTLQPVVKEPEPVVETPVAEELVTTEASVETGEPDVEIPLFEEPTADLSAEQAEPEGFDLFSLSEPDEEPESEFTHQLQAEEVQEETEEPVVEEEPFVAEEETAIPEMQHMDPIEEFSAEQEDSFMGEEPIMQEPETAPVAEESFAADKPEPVFEQTTEQPSLPEEERYPNVEEPAGNRHPLYDRLHLPDDSLASRLMSVRLDTLKGAFGFNERVQIVEELFHGSNEQYTEAIEKLDNLGSKEEARSVVSEYANRFSWSERSDLVMEFAKKVERRYA